MSAALKMIPDMSGRPAMEFADELAWDPAVNLVRKEVALPPIGYLTQVQVDGVERKLRQPLKLEFAREGNRVLASASFVSVWGSGANATDAVADLEEMLVSLYLEYARTPRSAMDAAAIVQARKIQRLFDA